MLFNKKLNKSISNFSDDKSNWIENDSSTTEGQLLIDVYQTEKNIIIKSTVAGVTPDNIKVSLHHDLLTIKGFRTADKEINDENYLYRECYWGSFSRSIILPFEVDSRDIKAEIDNGLLTISLKKIKSAEIEVVLKD